MKAVRMLARSDLRRRWRSVLVLTLLVGVSGAVALALVAGARRTDTSLQRFEAESRVATLEMDVGDASAAQIEELRRSPGVAAVGQLHQLALVPASGGFLPTAGQDDTSFGTVVDRARVIEGRLADLTKVDELAIGEALAAQLRVGIGDRLSFRSYSPAEILSPDAVNDLDPQGPRMSLRVVGIVRRPLDLGARGAAGGVLVPTSAFVERYRDRIGSWSGSLLRVRTDHGSADIPRVTRTAKRIFGNSSHLSIQNLSVEGATVQDAIDVTTVGLYLAAIIAALTAIVAIGIALSREVASADADQLTLSALGMRPRHRVAATAALGIPIALGGAALAVLGGLLASPVFPIGVAAEAEPSPGIRIDALALGAGLVVVMVVVLAVAVLAAIRTARVVQEDRDPPRPSIAARASSRFGAAPTVTVGMGFAIDRGRGRRALPVRSSLFGAAFGVGVVVAALVFSASLDHLVSTPAAFGLTWDLAAFDSAADPPSSDCGPITTRLTEAVGLDAVASLCNSSVEIKGRPVPGTGIDQLRGRIEPGVVDGRAPAAVDEVALGAETLAAAALQVGDRVRITGPGGARAYRVVGQAVFPSIDDAGALADGAAFTRRGLARLGDAHGGWSLLVRLARGADRAAAVRKLEKLGGGNTPVGSPLPAEIDRVRQIDGLPLTLAGFVALVALFAVGFALVSAVRRRRRDLAVLKTLGFERKQARATVAWHASTVAAIGLVVGIPFGLVAGRFVWRLVADDLGVSPDPTWPLLGVLVLIPAALVAVNLVAAVPAARAARMRPAVVLRSE